jgi:hypothetical protein
MFTRLFNAILGFLGWTLPTTTSHSANDETELVEEKTRQVERMTGTARTDEDISCISLVLHEDNEGYESKLFVVIESILGESLGFDRVASKLAGKIRDYLVSEKAEEKSRYARDLMRIVLARDENSQFPDDCVTTLASHTVVLVRIGMTIEIKHRYPTHISVDFPRMSGGANPASFKILCAAEKKGVQLDVHYRDGGWCSREQLCSALREHCKRELVKWTDGSWGFLDAKHVAKMVQQAKADLEFFAKLK